ncbi:MBL fold metallo-hydrolase [Thermoanaerobacterium sp. DL9XJH110]|uniref:MBL fold metallo-hydrolase n=1 Tax=Thermoanaerobacterium sp. DL9XJH110 TaxID=3386643 RepID=UPI003BB713F8
MVEIAVLASGSRGNCYRVTDGSTPILLECGVRFQQIQRWLTFRVQDLAACLVSHEHQDHARAMADMLRAGMDCYMSAGTQEALGISGHRVRVIRAREQFAVGTWQVLPFETQHDAAEPLGFLLATKDGEKVLYATDTYYIRYRFPRLTHIMIECNYALDILQENVANGTVPPVLRDRVLKSHFSLAHVKDFLRANDLSWVQEIWLLHLSDGNSDAERFKREIQELTGKEVYVAPAAQ